MGLWLAGCRWLVAGCWWGRGTGDVEPLLHLQAASQPARALGSHDVSVLYDLTHFVFLHQWFM